MTTNSNLQHQLLPLMLMSIQHSFPLKLNLSLVGLVVLLAGCNDKQPSYKAKPDRSAEYQQQIRDLTTERDSLKAMVQDLSRSPTVILADLTSALSSKDLANAGKAQAELDKRFPNSNEAADGRKQIEAYRSSLHKAAAEEKRLAALGFKALPVGVTVKGSEVTAKYGDLSFSARFVMDRYDSSYHYRDADRDTKFAVINMTVTAGKGVSDPRLPGAALYWADGATLKKLGEFAIEFVRWEGYATYLGNYVDSRNDFAKVQSIPFTLGVQVNDDDLRKRSLYVVVTRDGCISRHSERFRNPPDYYSGKCLPLKENLTLKDFTDTYSELTVVIRRD